MRVFTLLILLGLCSSHAHQDHYFRTYRAKGLMFRLVDLGGLGIPEVEIAKRTPDPFAEEPDKRFRADDDVRTIDMVPFFSRRGVIFREGTSCIFNPATSTIVARASREAHELIESICTTEIFEVREVLDVLKTYSLTLKPMSREQRWTFLQNYSYYPDDLLRALLLRHNRIDRLAAPPESKTQEKVALKKIILDLLEVSLARIETQLEITGSVTRKD